MVLEKLGESLKNTLNKISSALFVDDKLINELVKDIQKALLTSDINVKLVFELTKKIKDRALKEEPPGALSKKEWLIKIVYDELVAFLGEEEIKVSLDENIKPTTIMLVGLFGNGKTTTAAKLGKFYKKRGHTVALVSTDTWRPAAYAQLQQLGAQIEIPVFGNPKEKNPVKIYNQFKDELKNYELVIIDTAGRDALSDELIGELKQLADAVKPQHSWLVISADIGQAAEKQAKTFHETSAVDSVIITKMEGSARGGGALAACAVTGAKVGFIGVGEKIDDLEKFRPKNFVGKMLGMGDIEALLEKAKESISEEQAQDLGKKFLKGEFNLVDLYEQLKAVRKMGPLSKIIEMIPGFGQVKLPKEMMDMQEGKLDTWKFVMDSCTKEELEDPETISGNRLERIAKGSGRSVGDVRDMLKQYKNGKKMMKMLKGSEGNMEKMMKKMKGLKMPFR
ncbi:MAG: signal recognition particle protein Srp54 [Candidatus Woesearchaeota archaeon]|nr:signal recognition particle protein Srp54 [Candidatus Woesearchaeota archaeon]